MKPALLFLIALSLHASTLVPLNCAGTGYFECLLAEPGGEVALLSFSGLSATLESGPVAQNVIQSQDLDFTAPDGWAVTRVVVFGRLDYSGVFTSVAAWFAGPCDGTFWSTAATEESCSVVPGAQSGTITGHIQVASSAMPPDARQRDFGSASLGEVVLVLTDPPATGVPEPGTMGLLLACFAGLSTWWRK